VAAKKKKRAWTEEQKAKMRATIAAKKKRGELVGAQARYGKKKVTGKKKASRKQLPRSPIAASGAPSSIEDLLRAIVREEIRSLLSLGVG
jgi:hypothetical protein